MAVNLEQIEQTIQELRILMERLRNITITYKRTVDTLNLTPGQKQILHDAFASVKQDIQNKVSELP